MDSNVKRINYTYKNKELSYIRFLEPAFSKKTGIASEAGWPIISDNNTRQGYVLRNILKPAGYFFPGFGR